MQHIQHILCCRHADKVRIRLTGQFTHFPIEKFKFANFCQLNKREFGFEYTQIVKILVCFDQFDITCA